MDAQIDNNPVNGSFAGQRFRMQPEDTYSLALLLDRELQSGHQLDASLSYSYQSRVYFDDAFQPAEPISGLPLLQDGYGLLQGRIALSSPNRPLTLELWGQNLADEEYLMDAGNGGAGFGAPTFIAAPPRTYGLSLSWRFGDTP